MGSARFKLSSPDLYKLFKSLLLTVAAAAVVTLTNLVAQVDWSSAAWGPLVGTLVPFGLNLLRKLLVDSRQPWEIKKPVHKSSVAPFGRQD